jgi:superfamily II DNA/RNA helicase
MRTKHHAKKLAKQLTDAGIPSVDLHGNLSQVARDRNLAAFGAGDVRVLVATDVAARGVHVDSVELVVHVDPPTEHKAYLHRSGRTARAGSEGDVVTVVLPTQRSDVKTLLRKAEIAVTPQLVDANSSAVTSLVGDIAAYVKPQPRQAEPQRGQSQGGRSQGANAQRKRASRDGQGASRDGRGASRDGRPTQPGRVAQGNRAGGGRPMEDDASTGRPRRDRSGRPASSGQGQGQGQGASSGRAGNSGSGSGSASGSANGGNARGGAGRPAGKLQVGGLVGGSTQRGRGSRRAQG